LSPNGRPTPSSEEPVLTKLVTDFIADFKLNDAPAEAHEIAGRLIADCLSVTAAGTRSPAAQHVIAHVARFTGQPAAPVIGTTHVVPAPLAALANGTSAHALDFDDDEPAVFVGHPTSPVLTALISLGYLKPVSGAETITAYLVGSDVQSALARAVNPGHYLDGWHATSTLGVIGATAAGAKLIKLNSHQTAHALAIASSCVSGLKVNFGTMTKPFHVGRAAEAAVTAVLLASEGFTAADNVFDGPLGLLNVLSAEPLVAVEAFHELRSRRAVIEPGVAIKRYPSCSSTHPAVDALLELREKHDFNADSIERISCQLAPSAQEILIYDKPSTPLEAKFSASYCLAVAVVHGELSQSAFTPPALEDAEVMSLVDRIDVTYNSDLDQPKIGVSTAARVKVAFIDGAEVQEVKWIPKGSAGSPLTTEELWEKFRACTSGLMDEPNARSAFHRVLSLKNEPTLSRVLDLFRRCETDTPVRSETQS